LFFIDGSFFNLDDGVWRKYESPGYYTEQNIYVNELYSFRGKPTVFGTCKNCDDPNDLTAEHKEIIQYLEEDDEWITIGYMQESRIDNLVIEVPISFCDSFL